MKRLSFKNSFIAHYSLLIAHCLLLIILLAGCKKDNTNVTPLPVTPPPVTHAAYRTGVFIMNQGNFGTGTGTISFFDRSNLTVQQDIFMAVNNRPLGNVVQSLAIFNSSAYIVVNNAGKVEVANDSTFKSTGTITGLSQPRYFIGINAAKGYVSEWMTSVGNLAVINLTNNTISKTITVGNGPELMLLYNSEVFVINTGGDSKDSSISVINTQNDQLIQTISIPHTPSGICLDKNNKLWVKTSAHLLRINPGTYAIEENLKLPSDMPNYFSDLVINSTQDVLYYVYSGGIYMFNINNTGLPATPLISLSYSPYALGYDKTTNYIYVANPLNYTQNGYFYRYDPTSGAQIDDYEVGLIPGNFTFN